MNNQVGGGTINICHRVIMDHSASNKVVWWRVQMWVAVYTKCRLTFRPTSLVFRDERTTKNAVHDMTMKTKCSFNSGNVSSKRGQRVSKKFRTPKVSAWLAKIQHLCNSSKPNKRSTRRNWKKSPIFCNRNQETLSHNADKRVENSDQSLRYCCRWLTSFMSDSSSGSYAALRSVADEPFKRSTFCRYRRFWTFEIW